MKKERLLKLAEILKDVKPGLFDISAWVERRAANNNPCHTVACAVGWATQHPWFQSRGLCMSESGTPYFQEHYGEYAAAAFFGISLLQASYLFTPAGYSGREPTTRRVINRLHKFVETNGKIDWRDTYDQSWFRNPT